MRTLTARYPGVCFRSGRAFGPGATIIMLGKGRYALSDVPEPASIDPNLELARSIDPELAGSDPEAASHAGRYLRASLARGVSDVWRTQSGKEFYRNRKGLCEDAPCCGCCNA